MWNNYLSELWYRLCRTRNCCTIKYVSHWARVSQRHGCACSKTMYTSGRRALTGAVTSTSTITSTSTTRTCTGKLLSVESMSSKYLYIHTIVLLMNAFYHRGDSESYLWILSSWEVLSYSMYSRICIVLRYD